LSKCFREVFFRSAQMPRFRSVICLREDFSLLDWSRESYEPPLWRPEPSPHRGQRYEIESSNVLQWSFASALFITCVSSGRWDQNKGPPVSIGSSLELTSCASRTFVRMLLDVGLKTRACIHQHLWAFTAEGHGEIISSDPEPPYLKRKAAQRRSRSHMSRCLLLSLCKMRTATEEQRANKMRRVCLL